MFSTVFPACISIKEVNIANVFVSAILFFFIHSFYKKAFFFSGFELMYLPVSCTYGSM